MFLLKFALVWFMAATVVAERRFPTGRAEFDAETITAFLPRQEVDESYRLPTETIPTHYSIHLWTAIHEGEPDFQGSVDIHLNVVERNDTITVHNRDLVITTALLYRLENGELLEIDQPTYSLDKQRDFVTFQCSSVLEVGSYVLKIVYTGRLQTSSSSGFFRKYYRDENDNRRYIASTQFEPTHARMAFPCYDEPTLKATFSVSITHHRSYNAVSNMPVEGEPVEDPENPDIVTTNFDRTQIMSTYLLAFAVTDFETRELAMQQIHARPNAINLTELALEVGVDVLLALSVHTGISYYNYKPKLAQIAVPDWGTGAMENWGLVTYGEPVLLFDPKVNTYRSKIDIVTIIAHEYTHQWFGNLVTTDWWQYIWLNEGFASLYGYYGAELAYPGEGYFDFFLIYNFQPTLRSDSSDWTRPMNWNAATPAEISALFDGVAYGKAGSVLNMFRIVLGDDIWRAGLKKYLLSRELAAATPDDLYAGLQAAVSGKRMLPVGMTVKEVMETWTTAAGYPVLNVRRNYQSKEVVISQERFFADKKLPNDHVWYIPYNVANQRDLSFELDSFDWLTTKAAKLVTDIDPEHWMIFNRQQFGFYRVNYDTRNWELLTEALIASPTSFHTYNRAQLIDDAFNIARADLLDFSVVLKMLFALRTDREFLPWAAGNNVLNYLYSKLRGTEHYVPFVFYVDELIGGIYSSLKLDSVDPDESLQEKYLKQSISWWACRIGASDCLTRTEAVFKAAVSQGTEVHPDISSVVYCYGSQSGTDEEFLWLYQRMFNSNNPAERTLLIDAMGCSQREDHLEAFLTTSIGSGVGVEVNYYDSERNRVLQAVYSGSRTGVDALIDFLNDYDMADDLIYWLDQPAFNNAIAGIAARTNTQPELDRLKQLFETVGALAPQNVVDSALATVKANFDWFDSLEGLIVVEFLEDFLEGQKKKRD
ncbi:aminopeptidase N-like [Topomyia yanbarensis]|uniref:aminopeptidase N-like n=1 Tax=Topomyia yanbarensis TaxID=2498891 RepID=UPI00273B89C3|nr:aminopeptidase N-like [Topomyia yanbarensis]